MSRIVFLCLLIVASAPCFSMTKSSSNQQIIIEDESDDDDLYWVGPGLYWGFYISNEDDYWRHYDNRYPNRRRDDERNPRRAGNGRQGVRGDGGRSGGRH